MPIWKLAPVTTAASDDAWAYTRWFGPILVRARTSRQARKIAAEAFRKVREHEYEPAALASPWLNDGLVACSRVPVSTYRPEGPDQILQPQVSEYGRS